MVSIIIPTYRRPEALRRAISSVLKQSYEDLEIWVVNDDQGDDTKVLTVIRDFEDTRVLYSRNERAKGANGARNTGILKAHGDFISFLDDDDEWLEHKLKLQVSLLKSKEEAYGAVYSAYRIEHKQQWSTYAVSRDGFFMNDLLLDKVRLCAGSNLLIKRKIIDKIGLWDEELLRQQDLEFLARLNEVFKICFDTNVGSKIYGHNTPNPVKAFQEREKFILKISDQLSKLSQEEQDWFYATHYRRQSLYLLKQFRLDEAMKYWKQAREYQRLVLRKDVKILLSCIKLNLQLLIGATKNDSSSIN